MPFKPAALVALLAATLFHQHSAVAADKMDIPILVPVTGFLSLEGTAQRNGAIQAFENAPEGLSVGYEVSDTATSPEVAVNAMKRALGRGNPVAMGAPIFGTQMLAMLPLAKMHGIPLLTVSGTAKLTEVGNDYIFRFFPGDAVVKVAHAKFAVEELGAKKPALLYQTTSYGQSGRAHLDRILKDIGAPLVYEEALSPKVKDLTPALKKALATNPDVILLHLHSGPTALAVRQLRALGSKLPVVAGSAMHQPTTAALLEPKELEYVCAETASSPISGGTVNFKAFASQFRQMFSTEPDAFAVAQYDAISMALTAIKDGADTKQKVRDWLANNTYQGLAMKYKSDGKGNMAHDAIIVCYDGVTRFPEIVKRYGNVDGVL